MSKMTLRRRFGLALRVLRHGARNAYDAAAMHRLYSDWVAALRHPDDEIRGDGRRLRARARELSRNNSYAKRYLRLLKTNIIGPMGIALQGLVRRGDELDEETNDAIEWAWWHWATEPVTVDGKLTLRQLETLLVQTACVDGEFFVRMLRGVRWNKCGIALQVIDADLVDATYNRMASPGQNEIRMGIEVDEVGRPVAYHVWDTNLSYGVQVMRTRQRIPASQIIHHYEHDRPNQTRGLTRLHAAMAPAHMLNAYEDSEAIASRIAAAKSGFIVTQDPSMAVSPADDEEKTEPLTMTAQPGTFEELEAGKTVVPFDPQHPTGQFGAFVKQMLRKISSGLAGAFYNVLANDAEHVTYSTMRSFSLVERDDWRTLQQDFIDSWRRPLYREWLTMALLTGALPLRPAIPDRYLAVRHRPRGWSWIDPQNEVKAGATAIAAGLASRTAILAEKGEDIEDVFMELAAEQRLAKRYGISIDGDAGEEERLTEAEWEAKKNETGGGNGDGRELAETPMRRPSPPRRPTHAPA